MLKESQNEVKVEGVLSEINVEERESTKDPRNPYLTGELKIRVKQEIDGKPILNEVPVNVFAPKFTRAGKNNPAYESIRRVMDSYKSIAAIGSEEGADRISTTNGQIRANEFYGRGGNLISYPRLSGSFFNKPQGISEDVAEFVSVIVVGKIKEEENAEGLTGRLIVQGILVQYGGQVDIIDFFVEKREAIDHISKYWNQGDTVKVHGKVNFSVKTVYTEEQMGFGESIKNERTISVRELIITSGSPEGFPEDQAYDREEIEGALIQRNTRLNQMKEDAEKKNNFSSSKKSSFDNFGF